MTQASLSPDLNGALGASTSVADIRHPGPTAASPLWMIALTSTSLVVASLLLLGLFTRSAIADPAFGGLVAGVGIVVGAIGVGGVSYSLVTARRAGMLTASAPAPTAVSEVPAGMHVVPAVPPDLGLRKRQQLEQERATRTRQARAIAIAAATGRANARPLPPREPVTPTSTVAPRGPMTRPAPVEPVTPRATAVRTPVRPPTMPQAVAHRARPATWPNRAPALRMPPAPRRQRTQVAAFQIQAANVRAAVPVRPSTPTRSPNGAVHRAPVVSRQVR